MAIDRFYVAGHDRGGRTVHRMCLDHPDKVIKAAIIDIVPTLDMWAAMDKEGAIGGWHWPFMAQPADFPERMMGGVPADWFMRKKLLKLTADLSHIPPEIWDEYVRCFNEKTIRGSCADYRAAATIDCELDTADLGRKLAMPILVLWGKTSSVGKRFADPLGLWRQRAEDVRGEALPSGHYVNEEAPEQVLDWFLRFFDRLNLPAWRRRLAGARSVHVRISTTTDRCQALIIHLARQTVYDLPVRPDACGRPITPLARSCPSQIPDHDPYGRNLIETSAMPRCPLTI